VKDSLSSAVLWKLASNVCAILTAFASIRLYKLYLTKETYGAVLVAMQFLVYLPLISGGFGMVISQQMLAANDPEVTARKARYSQVLQSHILLVALVAACVLMGIYSQLPVARTTGLPVPLFFAIGLGGVATIYGGGQMGMMTPLGRQVWSIVLTAVWSVLGLVLLWIGFRLHMGVWAMPASTALAPILLIPVSWALQQRLMPGLPMLSWHRDADFWAKLVAVWKPSLRWLESQISIMFQFTLDIILMGMLFGAGPAAVYGIVSRVTTMSRQIIQAICDTAWPRLTQEPEQLRKAALMRKVDRLSAWIAGSWYGAMAATIIPFLGWLVNDWVAGPALVALMLARNLIISLTAPHGYGLLSAGRFKDLARATQREVVLSVAFIFLFSHFFGMIGVALGVLAATSGGSLWYMTYLYFHEATHTTWFGEWCGVYARGLVAAVIAFAAASLVWWLEKSLLSPPGWASLFAGGIGLAAGMIAGFAFGLSQSSGHTRIVGPIRIPTSW
jgi:O-antigen/teichoic acid export membrane protein